LSHTVTIQTLVRDRTAVEAACRRLGLAPPVEGMTELYSGEVRGLAVRLPDWDYPVVADLTTGEVKFDNFGGRWGNQKELDKFLQAHAVEKAKIEARKRGHAVTEQQLADGAIKLVIQVGRTAA
jgi:hypothetical protein